MSSTDDSRTFDEDMHHDSHIVGTDMVHTIMEPDAVFVVHSPEPDYSYLYGSKFNEEGELIALQHEYDGDQIGFLNKKDSLETF